MPRMAIPRGLTAARAVQVSIVKSLLSRALHLIVWRSYKVVCRIDSCTIKGVGDAGEDALQLAVLLLADTSDRPAC